MANWEKERLFDLIKVEHSFLNVAQGGTLGTATVKGRGPVCPVENWSVCSDDRLRFNYQDLRRIYNSFKMHPVKMMIPTNKRFPAMGSRTKNAGP